MELKHKTDEQINPVNGLDSRAMRSVDRQIQTKVEDKSFLRPFESFKSFELRVEQWISDGRWYQCAAS